MPSISEDTLTDVQMESSPELQTDASASESNSSERSSVYEADLSSHVASVAWPRRPEGRPPSVYSYHESLDSYLFRDSHGRTLNTKNECYVLPADELEHQRLDIQNLMVQYYLGAPYPAKDIVEEILKPREGYIPMILDVGTGSGAWALDMSLKFPHSEVIGLDIVPPRLRDENLPDNCRFEIDDCNLSFTHWLNTFNFIHVRSVDLGIHDFSSFLHNMAQIMKPGAILIVGAGLPWFFDENRQRYPDVDEGEKGFSWLQKAFTALFAEWVKAQSHINDADIPYRFSAKFLGDCAKSNPNFEQVTTWEMDVQIGNWKPAPTQELYYANELCKMNVLKLIEAYVPLMASSGVSEEWTKRWQFEAMKEIQEQKLHTYGRWRWMWCRRGDSEWIPNN